MKNIFKDVRSICFLAAAILMFSVTNTTISQWTQTGLDGYYIRTITAAGTSIFAGTSGDGMFRSTNSGINWVSVNSGLVGLEFPAFAVSGTNLFAGSEGEGVFRSTNNGDSWSATGTLSDPYIFALTVMGTDIYAGADGGGVYRSTNNGASWQSGISGMTNTRVFALAVLGTNLFAGTYGGGVFRSTDNGLSWTEVNSGLTSTDVWDIAVNGTNIYAAANGGVFLSTNNGNNWVGTGLTSYTNAVAFSGSIVFAGTDANGVFRSTNSGSTWENISTGLTELSIWALTAYGSNLFAGTNGTGVWKRPLSEITSVKKLSNGLPDYYSLGQNYPNPFNPTTKISFKVKSETSNVSSKIQLAVYNPSGQMMEMLINEELAAGEYEVEWNGSNYPSGVYFYTLKINSFSETKKMLLIK